METEPIFSAPMRVAPAPESSADPFAAMIQINPAQVLEHAQKQKQTNIAVLALTSPRDWVDLGGEPYLTAGGCQKIASVLGISIQMEKPVRENRTDEDGYHYYVYSVAIVAGRIDPLTGARTVVPNEGSASSKDDLFSLRWRDVQGADGKPVMENGKPKREKYRLPASEVDEMNVRKKAITNAYNRAIKGISGMGTYTWDELREFSGIEPHKSKGVSYDAGSKGGQGKTSSAEASAGKAEIRAMVLAMAGNDITAAQAILKGITRWEKDGEVKSEGVESVADLPDWRVATVLGITKREFKKLTGQDWRAAAAPADAKGAQPA